MASGTRQMAGRRRGDDNEPLPHPGNGEARTRLELLKKVRRIQIKTNRIVDETLSGQYHSVFKGRGMEFDRVRHYSEGDDPRTIDWNVTARTGSMYVKQYVEERELTVVLLVDVSRSGLFGTRGQTKGELAAELAALLAFSAIRNNDRVGALLFSDRVEKYLAPKKGQKHVLRVVSELFSIRPAGSGTSIATALEFWNALKSRRAVVFLISDFLDDGFERLLGLTGRRHDLVPVVLADPFELELPADAGLVRFEDPESGRVVVRDLSSPRLRADYRVMVGERRNSLARSFAAAGLEAIWITAGQEYTPGLVSFFRRRAKRR